MAASLAVMTADGRTGVIIPADELEIATATSAAELISYQPETLDRLTTPAEALIAPLRSLLQRLVLSGRTVGTDLEGGSHAVAYQSQHRFRTSIETLLQHALPGVKIQPAGYLLARLRSIKTPSELANLRRAATLASAGFLAAEQAIQVGRREDQVAADIEAAFSTVALNGFERGRGYFFCMSGPNAAKAAGAYARTRARVLEAGDLVMIHANTVGDGLWTDITRTYVAGQPTSHQQRMFDAVATAREAALQAVAPGAAAKEVDEAARSSLTRASFGPEFKHPVGHGVGFSAADPNALPRLHPLSPDILAPGMTFNIEPAIYIKDVGGIHHCDVVACTEAGAEVLTTF